MNAGYPSKALADERGRQGSKTKREATLSNGEGDLKTLNRIHAMIERQARLIQTFATKLRLTQQSRYTAATAAVVAGKASGTRPWDEGK
jgi:hypothetical protein